MLLTMKMVVVVPENFPYDRFTEKEVFGLRGALRDELCEAEDPTLLQIVKSYHKEGALVLIYENEDTRIWIKWRL